MKSTYDIIVLGAGAAGCAAAKAIATAYPTASVALVEQGSRQKPPAYTHIPMLQPFLPLVPGARRFMRQYKGAAEENLGGRQPLYIKGCGLGGSSLVNDMRYMRGSAQDFSSWNDEAWTFDKMLPYFTSLESNRRESSSYSSSSSSSAVPLHGEKGPIKVSDVERSNMDSSMNVRFFEACEAAGVAQLADFNAGDVHGFSCCQSLTERGARVDVFDALLESSKHLTPNLSVHTERRALKLLFSGGGEGKGRPSVSGVQLCERGGTLTDVGAKHVVVCLGAIDTPALLLRSGVGPGGAALDLPGVGENLIVGTTADLVFKVQHNGDVYSKSFSSRNVYYLFRQWREYKEDRTGVFSSLVEGMAVVQGSEMAAYTDTPNLSLSMFRTPQMGSYWRPFDGFTLRITNHYPKSRGSITCDAGGEPVIRANLLREREDVEAMDQGIQWAGLLTSRELRSVHYQDHNNEHVGPFTSYNLRIMRPEKGLTSQKDTAMFLAQYAMPAEDLFGTCALGTVVDTKLRLQGVEGVSIADSSVVPQPTVASSSVLGAAIGARVAELI